MQVDVRIQKKLRPLMERIAQLEKQAHSGGRSAKSQSHQARRAVRGMILSRLGRSEGEGPDTASSRAVLAEPSCEAIGKVSTC